jgi:MSHA biogenesis protein MshI
MSRERQDTEVTGSGDDGQDGPVKHPFARRKSGRRVARARCGERIATAVAPPPFRAPLALAGTSLLEAQDGDEAKRVLRALATRRDRLHVVLPWDAFDLFLVERPEVPPAEIRGALRWKIRDLVDYHPDDATLDAFEVPVETRPGSPRMIYVVVSPTSRLRSVIEDVAGSPAPLSVLDIPELCLRNLVATHPAEADGVVSVYCEERQGCLLVSRGRTLYLTRRLDFGHNDNTQGGPPGSFAERIALEIQRSLDYVDRYYRLPLPKTVLLLPLPGPDPDLPQAIGSSLGLACTTFSLSSLLTGTAVAVAPEDENRLCLAVGALLRDEGGG